MEKQEMETIHVVGISVRTTNENNQQQKDIGELWGRFMSANLQEKIPNILHPTTYAVYTNYESDHTKPYTMILGFPVPSLDNIPEGLEGVTIAKGNYSKFTAKGDLTNNAVVDAWHKIWETDLDRTYTTDFEVYGEKSMDPTNGEADIFIAVK